MEIINNIDHLLGENLKLELCKGSKVSIAASCFSIYAYEALMKGNYSGTQIDTTQIGGAEHPDGK